MSSGQAADSSGWEKFFDASLAAKRAANLVRVRGGARTLATRVDFSSNDYLGLSVHPQMVAAQAVEPSLLPGRFGSGASPVLCGHTQHHAEVERKIAELSGAQDALVFSSGYACNVGVVSCLADRHDLILSDSLNHASLIDGCRLSRAEKLIYPHNELNAVRDFLKHHRQRFRRALLITESVFSMDGDHARLPELADLCDRWNVGLVVDEAHATGVYGPCGGGLLSELSLQHRVLAKLGTLSKALGTIGGYVCGGHSFIEYLINHCRSYLFSTAPPIPVMQATAMAIDLLKSMDSERATIRRLSQSLRSQLSQVGWQVPPGDSPIVPLIVGSESSALELSLKLAGQGLSVPAIRPPTVPEGTSRLRISLSARHTDEQLAELIAALVTMQEP